MSQSKESLEQWRTALHKLIEDNITENGRFPRRMGSTGHAVQSMAIDEIIDLAQKQLDMQARGGSIAKKLATQYLREMVDELESTVG